MQNFRTPEQPLLEEIHGPRKKGRKREKLTMLIVATMT
jgi:hypothetical protein